MPAPWPVVLGSASPARLRLLRAAGLDPVVVVSHVDEEHATSRLVDPTPAEVCAALARAKARQVKRTWSGPSAVIIAADSVLDVDGVAFGKPGSREVAEARLLALRGRSAQLRTGHCLIRTDTAAVANSVVATTVRFGDYDNEELSWYLDTGESQAVAGGFTLDGLSAPFMNGIIGDHGNVIGLSLPGVRELLADLGIRWIDLAFNRL